MSEITKEEIEKLKTYTESLMNHVYWVKQTFDVVPFKNHIATCINYVDLNERKSEFCRELINTIPEWIYSKEKYKEVFEKLETKRGKANASNELSTICFEKFRGKFNNGNTDKLFAQGQFGELLLFNFLQKFYSAVPLLRKMPITTGTGLERNGADAIHYAISDSKNNLFFLGESKAYTTGTFSSALKKAIESILKTFNEFSTELGLYIYDDFLEEKLQEIAENFKEGTLNNVEVHLILLIAYNENSKIEKNNEAQIKSDIIKTIENKCSKLEKKIFLSIDKGLHPRFNYIFFPIWELDKLIENFQTGIGK